MKCVWVDLFAQMNHHCQTSEILMVLTSVAMLLSNAVLFCQYHEVLHCLFCT